MLHTILTALVPIFAVLALGYAAGRSGRIAAAQIPGLNSLVMEFAVPAALFVAIAAAPRPTMLGEWRLFVLLGLGIMVPYAAWYGWCRRCGHDSGEAAVQALTVGLPNYVAAGLPVMAALYGAAGTVLIAVTIAAGPIVPSPVTLLVLELGKAEGSPRSRVARSRAIGRALRRALTRPVVLAPLAGLACSLGGLAPPELLARSLDLIGKASGGAALFVTGLVLSAQPVRLDTQVALAVLCANVGRPLVTLAACRLTGAPWEVTKVAVLMNALPCGFFGILFGIGYGRPSARAGSIVLASTLTSAATLAVAIAALFAGGSAP